MSRIGKRPSRLPSGGVRLRSGQTIEVKGPKGARSFTATGDVNALNVATTPSPSSRVASPKRARQAVGHVPHHGPDLVTGVTDGFKKELEIQGVGYRAQMQGNTLKLAGGFTPTDVDFEVPAGVTVSTPKNTEVIVEGADQQLVGQVAANIR